MMHMKNFSEYVPEIKNIPESLHDAAKIGGVFIKDDEGRDFYASQYLFSEDTLKVVYDKNHNVLTARVNVSDTFPIDCSLIEIPYQDYDDSRAYTIDTNKRTLILNILLENSGKKQRLLDEADTVIQPLLGYAVAGVLGSNEMTAFKAWNEYRKALEDVDVTATDIEWPTEPE